MGNWVLWLDSNRDPVQYLDHTSELHTYPYHQYDREIISTTGK